MSRAIDATRPADLHRQLGGGLHPVPIRRVWIGADGPAELARRAADLAGGGPVLLVCDETPKRRDGADLDEQLMAALGPRVALTVKRLAAGPDGELHADLAGAQALGTEAADYALLISAGSGTVTDLVKYARHLAAPAAAFLCYPTAASVTAFGSALAVLLLDGVKRTLPARPPDEIVCDLPTLCAAPPRLTRAGFGDVIARSVSYGDWWLAEQLGLADGFTPVAGELLAGAEQAMIDLAQDVAVGGPAGTRAVIEALLLAGYAMSLVGQTAPLSGWEHVISHWLDMTAAHDGRRCALHGEQVGVATLVAARAYEAAWPQLDLDRLTADWTAGDQAAYERELRAVFDAVDPSGAMTAECWRDAQTKLARWRAARPQRREFARRWAAGELEAELHAAVRPAAEVASALARAGAPERFEELSQPVGREQAVAAVAHAHMVRARFTLGDLLAMTGWLSGREAQLLG
jgi:glycerol-1-phosphate dehydrogenase [NAD(P)+]